MTGDVRAIVADDEWAPVGSFACFADVEPGPPYGECDLRPGHDGPHLCRPRPASRYVSVLATDWHRARLLLAAVEWVQPLSNSNPECPICSGREHTGHNAGCSLAAALGKGR